MVQTTERLRKSQAGFEGIPTALTGASTLRAGMVLWRLPGISYLRRVMGVMVQSMKLGKGSS